MDPIEIETDGGGILAFDGRVLEHFDSRGRSSDWRTHVRHVVDWRYEPRKGVFEVKVMVGRRDHRSLLFDDAVRAEVEHLETLVRAALA